MTFTVPGPAVPGLMVPGQAVPGEASSSAVAAAYQYIGLVPVTYLQYLGPAGTLSPVPGAAYQTGEIVPASGWPHLSAVPPQDGRWLLNGALQGTIREEVALDVAREASRVLRASRAMNADRHAAMWRGEPWPPPE